MRGYNLDEIYKLFFFNFQKKRKKMEEINNQNNAK